MRKILFLLAFLPLLTSCGDYDNDQYFATEKECVKAVYDKAAGDYRGFIVREHDYDIIDTLGEVSVTVGGSKTRRWYSMIFPSSFLLRKWMIQSLWKT